MSKGSTVLINTYSCPSRLFIIGGGEIQSQEATTQGDSMAMPFYAISTPLLISLLHNSFDKVRQVCLACSVNGRYLTRNTRACEVLSLVLQLATALTKYSTRIIILQSGTYQSTHAIQHST